MPLELPQDAVSRAWLKMEEALRWSQLPIPRGARVADIGSAPGGASQALLAHGLLVTGIDPAEMAPSVLKNPPFFAYPITKYPECDDGNSVKYAG